MKPKPVTTRINEMALALLKNIPAAFDGLTLIV